MSVVRCPQGHFYDSDKNSSCPWCGVSNLDCNMDSSVETAPDDTGKTVAVKSDATGLLAKSLTDNVTERTVAFSAAQKSSASEGMTVSAFHKKIGIDPVVGWLVCVRGADKGRDYRIHSEKNTIGRSDSMDIVVKGDDTISRINHAFLMHNPHKNTFRITNGEGRGLIYVNGEDVSTYIELHPYDEIEIGESVFLFIPFCSERFSWKDVKSEVALDE